MDILDGLSYPSAEEWTKLYDRKKDAFDRLQITNTVTSFNILDVSNTYYGIKLSNSIDEYDNRTFDLINNYVLLASFYEKGIPDEEWYKSPGDKGGVKYFPNFNEDDHIKHYWFNFYVESYYTRFYGVVDHIYHMLNAKYRMDLEPAFGFNKQVMKKLKLVEPNLHGYLKELKNDETMKEINNYRNDFAHNLRPSQLDHNLIRKVKDDGSVAISSTVGKYTTTSLFMRNIEHSIDLLARINEEIKGYISEDAN